MTRQEAIDYLEKLSIDTKIGNANQSMSSALINMSMEALEKQIPIEPIDKIMYRECPKCGSVDLGKYCIECGQAIKWE